MINVAMALALYTQISHAGYLFTLLSHDKLNATRDGYIAGISIEAAVFIFTLYGNKACVLLFAIFSVITNLFYYITPETIGDWHKWGGGAFFSLIIPAAIFFYSEVLKSEATRDKAKETYAANKAAGKTGKKTRKRRKVISINEQVAAAI